MMGKNIYKLLVARVCNSVIVTTSFTSALRILIRVKNGEYSCGVSLSIENILVQVNLVLRERGLSQIKVF